MAPTFWILTPEKGVTSIPVIFVGRAIYARKCFRVAPSMQGFLSPKFPSLHFPSPLPLPLTSPFSFLRSLSHSLPPFPFSFPFPLLSLLLSLYLYKWNGSVTYRWHNPQSWFPEEKSWSLSLSFSPVSFLPSLSPLPFPFVIPFPLSPSAFLFPLPFLNSLSLSPFSFPFPFLLSPSLFSFLPFSLPFLFLLFPFSFSSSFSFPFTHGTQW